jgi:prolyl-tRNA synthetase
MRQSQLFTKTLKDAPRDEESTNAKLLVRAGFVNKEMAGVYTILPLGIRVMRKIEQIIRDEMIEIGGQEIFMPSLHPSENWKKTGRWDTYDTLFRFQSFYSKIEYGLGPTHEEIVTPLAKRFILSYKDLPKYVFQIHDKFRDEKRAKSGLLRGREFLMSDLYSFHRDEKDADAYYETVKASYERIFQKIGIGEFTYFTFASGGTFSKYSHEFQALTLAGEDEIYICQLCRVAVNKEIIKEQNVCPECQSPKLQREKAIEVGNIFKLKTRFSDAFELMYKDEKGVNQKVLMGCYGIGGTRLMGTIVELFHDDKGILWPKSVAPALVHLLSLEGGEQKAEKLYEDLLEKGVEVLYDDRKEVSAGEKFVDADLIGIPWRVVVSAKTLEEGKVEIKKRSKQEKGLIDAEEIMEYINAP